MKSTKAVRRTQHTWEENLKHLRNTIVVSSSSYIEFISGFLSRRYYWLLTSKTRVPLILIGKNSDQTLHTTWYKTLARVVLNHSRARAYEIFLCFFFLLSLYLQAYRLKRLDNYDLFCHSKHSSCRMRGILTSQKGLIIDFKFCWHMYTTCNDIQFQIITFFFSPPQ